MPAEQKTLRQLFFPIFFELLFSMLAGTVDTLMLSSVGDYAVGAVGTANTYFNVFIVMFTIISSGMTAVMTQYIGAKRPGVARIALRLGLMVNLIFGLAVSAVLYFGSGAILKGVGIADQLLESAETYMKVVGLFCICNALIPIYSSYLRSFGHASPTMTATIIGNIVNLALNALFLFVFHWGVWGIAVATGIARVINLLWLVIASRRRINPERDPNPPAGRDIVRAIVRIGLPGAMESTLWNVSMTLIIGMLNNMDQTGMQVTARSYAMQLANFTFCVGAALSFANAIQVGWHIGGGELEKCSRNTNRAAAIGLSCTLGVAALIYIFARPLMSLFSDDPAMIELVRKLMLLDVMLELGRVTNLVYGNALKTSGDALFTMVIAVVSTFLVAAGGTWFFGIRLGWLAVGAFLGMALDECTRAVLMFIRWQTGKWKKLSLVEKNETIA